MVDSVEREVFESCGHPFIVARGSQRIRLVATNGSSGGTATARIAAWSDGSAPTADGYATGNAVVTDLPY